MNLIDYDSTLQEKEGEITLFCCAGIHVLPKLLGRSCLSLLPTGAKKHFLFIASPRPARTPRRRGSRCARAAAGRAAAPAPGHRPRRPASVHRFGRVSGPLSSWRGPRTALNCSYRGERVTRGLTCGVKSARRYEDQDADLLFDGPSRHGRRGSAACRHRKRSVLNRRGVGGSGSHGGARQCESAPTV